MTISLIRPSPVKERPSVDIQTLSMNPLAGLCHDGGESDSYIEVLDGDDEDTVGRSGATK